MAKDLQDQDVFGFYVDKGLDIVFRFLCFVKASSLSGMSISSPTTMIRMRTSLTYVGQFYQEKSHLVPNEVLIPQDIDEETVLVDTKIYKLA